MPALTDVLIRSLKVDRRLDLWDDVVTCLLLRCSPTGAKSWSLLYRFNGKRRRYTLGAYRSEDSARSGFTLAEARRRARALLRELEAGRDPQGIKQEARSAITLSDLIERYIKDGQARRAPRTTDDYGRTLEKVIRQSTLGRMAARSVRRADIKSFLDTKAKETPIYANRILALIRAAYRWGFAEEIVEADPTMGIKPPRKERPRERVLSDDEIRVVWNAVDELGLVVAAAVRTLLLLGTRRTETLRMRWQDLDLNAGTWVIPGEFRKGGRTHVVPLPRSAIRIVLGLRGVTDHTPLVFSGDRGASIVANPARWTRALRKTTGVDFKLHDLRRTCATGCARLGASENVVSRILGHKISAGTVAVTAVYQKYDRLTEMAAALNAWAAHVETIASGEKRRGEVVTMGRT
ncbi:MAG: tyrosine-type recombinase/integrase [Vicinamibacteria bacterium]|nr:tyrosine-type recombinase/integrase [Vicinamibacteria bacterium]